MLQPRSIGGMEMKPSDFARVTEAISAADGSDRLGGMPEQWMLDVRGVSGAAGSKGDVWAGRRHPGLGTARCAVRGRAGARRLLHLRHMALRQWQPERHLARGAYEGRRAERKIRTLLFPKSSATMVDIWHTLGLRGTASNEYVVKDLFVPGERYHAA